MSKPENIQYKCVCCDQPVEESRATRRMALELAVKCVSCAKATTKTYVAASVGGNLIITNNEEHKKFIQSYHKGSHALQG